MIYTNRDAAHRQCLSLYLDRNVCERIGLILAGETERRYIRAGRDNEADNQSAAIREATISSNETGQTTSNRWLRSRCCRRSSGGCKRIAAWLAVELALDAAVRAAVGW